MITGDYNRGDMGGLGADIGVNARTGKPRVRFSIEKRKRKSANEWYDVEMVEFMVPGDKTSVPKMLVRDHHREEFHEAYQRWKQGLEIAHDGTPLEMWAPMQSVPAMVANLKIADIYTVEQLADTAENFIPRLGMGVRAYWSLAKQWVEASKDQASFEYVAKENEELKARVRENDDVITRLAKQVQELEERVK